ncbi:MAG TPA: biotin--[acetyl-CoA-carboxylase] ligase [Nitrospira sp.]|nr:biotin--[acetyl-CoA-carboxylase] ligase [Nitrospira sp.]
MSQVSPIDPDAIRSTLATRALGHRIELFDRIDSTNREAVALAQADIDHGTVIVADSQTAGRGRLARTWFSPPGVNLYCSIVVRLPIPSDRLSEWLSWLPLSASLAAAEAIESVVGVHVTVKWPNDLLMAERKIGGILCESGSTSRSEPFQVVGLGINVNGRRADFPPDICETATTIAEEAGRAVDRNRLLAGILQELEVCLDEFVGNHEEKIAIAYSRRCVTLGRRVRASLPGQRHIVGIAESVGRDGSLQIAEETRLSDTRVPRTVHVRAADILHLRSGELVD